LSCTIKGARFQRTPTLFVPKSKIPSSLIHPDSTGVPRSMIFDTHRCVAVGRMQGLRPDPAFLPRRSPRERNILEARGSEE
jgi:hypothetical protein